MTTPTPELVALLELSERATQGEWASDHYSAKQWKIRGYLLPRGGRRRCIATLASTTQYETPALDAENEANAQFIAALVNWFRSTRAATVPQGVSEQDALDARRFRDLVGWYDGLKMSRAETVCDLLGLPEADAINAGFNDLVDAYAENRHAAMTPPPAELGKGS